MEPLKLAGTTASSLAVNGVCTTYYERWSLAGDSGDSHGGSQCRSSTPFHLLTRNSPQGCAELRPLEAARPADAPVLLAKSSLRLRGALERLHVVLQGVAPQSRLAAIQSMCPRLRACLTEFIINSRKQPGHFQAAAGAANGPRSRGASTSARTTPKGIVARPTGHYKACMDIMALRIYTRWTADLNEARRFREVLLQLRSRLRQVLECDSSIWYRAEDAYCTCKTALRASGVSEGELGLGVIVSLRACRWLGARQVVSPSQSLQQALDTQARLLCARNTSWDAFRAEWVRMMPAKRCGVVAQLSLSQAEAIADDARQRTAEARISSAISAATRALARTAYGKARKLQASDKFAVLQTRAAAKTRTNVAAQKRKRDQDRRQWVRRRDLTMEEIMRGPPAYLREV